MSYPCFSSIFALSSSLRANTRSARRENIPALPASDWSAVRIYLRFLRLMGPPQEYTYASCV
eukprot:2458735-Pyramimonas_sp.AAC.1